MSAALIQALVIRQQAGFYAVFAENREITCKLRGKLKEKKINEDLAAIGDRVLITLLSPSEGVIEKVMPREKAFYRLAPTARGECKQILIANPDKIFLVFACAEPAPSLRMLDRFLVIAEKQKIPPVIVANKVDLVGEQKAREIFEVYPRLGYKLILTSVKQELNIDLLRCEVQDSISAFSGPSGVGKSSLLNAVQPGLGMLIGRLKESSGKGRHTTVVRQLIRLEDGGFVADMPGLRSLSLWDTHPEELDGYFPELRDLVADCQFNNCSHIMEPGCAVRRALAEGRIHPARYESYVKLRNGDE